MLHRVTAASFMHAALHPKPVMHFSVHHDCTMLST